MQLVLLPTIPVQVAMQLVLAVSLGPPILQKVTVLMNAMETIPMQGAMQMSVAILGIFLQKVTMLVAGLLVIFMLVMVAKQVFRAILLGSCRVSVPMLMIVFALLEAILMQVAVQLVFAISMGPLLQKVTMLMNVLETIPMVAAV